MIATVPFLLSMLPRVGAQKKPEDKSKSKALGELI